MGKKDYPKEHTDTLLDEHVIGRLKSHGENFEIIVEPDAVEKFRGDKEVDLLENMPVEKVFSDAKKGKEASDADIQEAFETDDIEEVAEIILQKGDVQITTEQRRKMQEQKKKEIIDRIVRNSMNPQTEAPHPPVRIENAIKEANVHIDPFKPVSIQVDEVVDEIRSLIPLSFQKLSVSIKVRGDYQGKIYGILKNKGNIRDEEWLEDGRWHVIVKIPAGVKSEFFETISEKTKGNADIDMVER